MTNAQEWLDRNYPLDERARIIELHISSNTNMELLSPGNKLEGFLRLEGFINLKNFNCANNLLTNLDLNDCFNLVSLYCPDNQLINASFLSIIPFPEKLTMINLENNDFSTQDLSFLKPFVNLEKLFLGSYNDNELRAGIHNHFSDSLEPLKNLDKLKELDISNTDINDGLEYLPDSIEKFVCFSRESMKANKIRRELSPFGGRLEIWKEVNKKLVDQVRKNRELERQIMELQKENQQFRERLVISNRQQNQTQIAQLPPGNN